MEENLFLRTKLYIPPFHANWVPRPDLVAQLDAGLARKLILLSAPAGFGKTTLLSEWIHHRKTLEGSHSHTKFAWLSLDEGDNDANRFLAYLTRALQSVNTQKDLSDQENIRLGHPQAQAIINSLINWVDEQIQTPAGDIQVVLVLDDYQFITTEPVHQTLAYLLDHLPAHMHLVIATRADPPISLARLRARGEILELRASQLRFSLEETRGFFNRTPGIDLSDKDMVALANRTEGWIAGLQMTALAMQDELRKSEAERDACSSRESLAPFIHELTGTNRYIMDYLVEEVLQSQPGPVQTFLIKTSILNRMCAPLCGALLQAEDLVNWGAAPGSEYLQASRFSPAGDWLEHSRQPLHTCQNILEYLERTNLFLVPLDDRREWYRYHRLFSDLLIKQLNLAFPNQVSDLHLRASKWFEQYGEIEEAIEHSFVANDEMRTVELVSRAAQGLMVRSEFTTLRRWLDRLPDEHIATRPSLCVYHAWILFFGNSPLNEVEERLALIQAYDQTQTIKAAPIRAYIAAFRGLIPQASFHARQALEQLPEEDTFLRSMAQIVLASCELSEGDPEAGYRAFEQASLIGHQTGNIMASVIALASLADNYRKLGQLHLAESLYRQALDISVDPKGKRLPITGRALCGLGDLLREWNRLEEAERFLKEGIDLLENWGVLAIYSGYIALAKLKQAQGSLPEAMEVVRKVQRLAAQTRITPIDDWIADLELAWLSILCGDLDIAEAWAARRGLLHEPDLTNLRESEIYAYTHLRKYELVELGRLRIAQGRYTEALHVLDSLLLQVVDPLRVGLMIELQLLRAIAYSSLDQMEEAFKALGSALSDAEPGGYMRIFLDEGEPIHRLLAEAHQRNPSSGYLAGLVAAFDCERAQAAVLEQKPSSQAASYVEIEPLSAREKEVLALLGSRLTVPEMAESLYVAESTVRSHIKSIYSKLAVHRRMDAVQRAEELGLLQEKLEPGF